MHSTLASALQDLTDARDDLERNGCDGAQGGFARVVAVVDAEPLRSLVASSLPEFDFAAWWNDGANKGRSMSGSAQLVWPEDLATRVAAQIALCRLFVAGRNELLHYMYRVLGPTGNLDDRLREVVGRVVDPLLRDLERIASRRTPPPGLDVALRTGPPSTGDPDLDQMLSDARAKFYDSTPTRRKEGLERLWDAYERIKTILDPADKKRSTGMLLDLAAPRPRFRAALEQEALALKALGNDLQIRHFEHGKEPVEQSEQIDYLFHRCFAFVWLCAKSIEASCRP